MGPVWRRWVVAALVTTTVGIGVVVQAPVASGQTTPTPPPISFPVEGPVKFTDDFGVCRGYGCSRRHQGIDMLGSKLQPLLAAVDGTITWARLQGSGLAGNSFVITDANGWEYWYLHINNDSPGIDDGRSPFEWMFAPGVGRQSKVKAGQHIAFMGDSGNAETTPAHLHFEIQLPDNGPAVNPFQSLLAAHAGSEANVTRAIDNLPVLRRGVLSVDVIQWQKELNARRGAGLPTNGMFGPLTEAATRAFQKAVGITADGIVGRQSRAAMAALPLL